MGIERVRVLGIAAATAALLCSARAEASNEASAAFEAGDFARARAVGRIEADAAGLSIACQAGLVLGSYFETGAPRVASLHAAIADCAQAIKTGGADVEAYVNYAIGVAFEAKRVFSPRIAGDAKDLLQASISRFPNSGFARGALAGWHANVVEQGVLARTALGASRESAREGFDAALKLDPKNFALNYEYLRFLAVGGKAERARGAKLAKSIQDLPQNGAFERLLADRAAKIGVALETGSAKQAQAALKATEPFATVQGEPAPDKFELPFTDSFPPAGGQSGAAR